VAPYHVIAHVLRFSMLLAIKYLLTSRHKPRYDKIQGDTLGVFPFYGYLVALLV